ncbi:MAG TPA: immunoglobulin-like domain-containing protein [Bacteroidia bacterium]
MDTKFTKSLKFAVCSIFILFGLSAAAQPIITLNGKDTIYIERGSTYVSLGATAYDTIDGNITDSIKVVNDVTTEFTGICTETYSVKNSRGQYASVIRFVIIRNDLTLPILTLLGDDTVYVEAARNNPSFQEPGATATDNFAPFNLNSSIRVSGTVDTRRVGVYTLLYNVEDISGNKAPTKKRIVIVRDTRAPEWINTNTPVSLPFGVAFVDDVDIIDAYDNDIAFTVSYPVTGPVDVNKSGQYDYIYVAEPDSSGNQADTLFKTYIVEAKVSIDVNNIQSLNLYPQPANETLNIQLNVANVGAEQIKIYNANGSLIEVNATQLNDQHFAINTSDLAAGIYFVSIQLGDKVISEKFIKE